MKALKDKPNTVAAGGNYPYGDLRDNPGNNTGTPYNRELFGDIQRTVEKIMDESGIVANGLDDNDANGYQVYEAMIIALKPYRSIQGYLTNTGMTINYNDTGHTVSFSTPNTGVFDIDITGSAFINNKTFVTTSNKNTAQSSTTLITTGGDRVSVSRVTISAMAFINMNSGGATAAGVVVGGGLHPNPIHFEIRIYK